MLQITPKRLGNVCKTFVFTLFVCSFFFVVTSGPFGEENSEKKTNCI
jgi:hypothetical protein